MTATSLADTLNLTDIGVTIDNHVAVVEIQKGPNNFFDTKMINDHFILSLNGTRFV